MATSKESTTSSRPLSHTSWFSGITVVHELPKSSLERASSPDMDLENPTIVVPEWKPQRLEYLIMFTLALISLVVALDATILVPVLPTLATDLHGTAIDAFWAGTSYLLCCAVCQPFLAALSDIFGRREVLCPSLLLFTIGSIICGVSKDVTQMLVGRCIQGIGGGGIITLTQIIFADIVPLRQRPKYFSLVLAAWGFGSVLGPLIGGVFSEHSWKWCFWINLPFCVAGLVLVPVVVKLKTEKTSLKSKLLRVDWLGGFLFIGGMTSFLVGLSFGGVQYAWQSYHTLAPLFVGLFAVGMSLVWERFGAVEPFLRKSLFLSVSAVAAYLNALANGLILFCTLYYLPLFFMGPLLYSPVAAGLALFAATTFLLPGSAVTSQLITRLGRFRAFVWVGWAVTTAGCGLFILLDTGINKGVWIAGCMVFGLGTGMVLSSVNFAIQAIVRPEDAGRAASMYAFMRTLGMAIGVTAGGTTFNNLMANKLKSYGSPTSLAQDSLGLIGKLKTMPKDDPTRAAILASYVHGIKGIFVLLTAVAGASLLVSFLIKTHSMDKVLESKYKIAGTITEVATVEEVQQEKDVNLAMPEQPERAVVSGSEKDVEKEMQHY